MYEITCDHCGWKSDYKTLSCPKCHEFFLCPNKCGEDKDEGKHFMHLGNCTWYDGPCEEPIWCECIYIFGK